MKLDFSWQIFEKYSSIFMKIRPVGAELFHVGGKDRHTWRSQQSLFAVLRTRLKTERVVNGHCLLLLCIGHEQTADCLYTHFTKKQIYGILVGSYTFCKQNLSFVSGAFALLYHPVSDIQ